MKLLRFAKRTVCLYHKNVVYVATPHVTFTRSVCYRPNHSTETRRGHSTVQHSNLLIAHFLAKLAVFYNFVRGAGYSVM